MKRTEATDRHRFADLVLSIGERSVRRAGSPIRLGKLTFDFLATLVTRAPNVVSHAELAETVWPGRIVTPDNMARRVSMLRHALGDDARDPKYIRVLHGQGYQLIPPVTHETTRYPAGRWLRHRSVAALFLFVVVIAGGGWIAGRSPNPTIGAPEWVPGPATAVERWREALAAAPNDQNSLVGLGRLLCGTGAFDEALQHLRAADRLYADSPVVLSSLAVCLVLSGRADEASTVIARGAALAPAFQLRSAPVNTGFERGLAGWVQTFDSTYRAGVNRNFQFSADRKNSRSGQMSGRLEADVSGSRSAVLSSFMPLELRGSRVRLSAQMMGRGLENAAYLWLRVDSVFPSGLATTFFDNSEMRSSVRGDTDWTREEIVFDVPQNAAFINFGFGFIGKGTVWVDDIAFERVDQAVPLTAAPVPPPPTSLATAENLDFDEGLAAWSYADDGASGRTSRVEWRNGAAALVVSDAATELRQEIAAGDFRNQRVRLRVDAKPEYSSGPFSGAARLAAGNFYVKSAPIVERHIDLTDEWTAYELVIDVPEDSTKISLWFTASGRGTLLVDDIELEIVDKTVPVTVMPQR